MDGPRTPPTNAVAPVVPPFDWQALSPTDREWLREQMGPIKLTFRRVSGDLVLLGQKLREVKNRIGPGHWSHWCAAEFGLSRRTAARFVGIADAIEGIACDASDLALVDPTAMYTLTEPGVPRSALEYGLSMAKEGERVTATVAREIVDSHRMTEPIGSREVRELAPNKSDNERAVRTAVVDPVLEALSRITGDGSTLHVVTIIESDANGGAEAGRSVCATLYPADGGRAKYAVRESIEEVILALADAEPVKQCSSCRDVKPLSRFVRRAGEPDGRGSACRDCERPRIRRLKAKRQAKQKAAAEGRAECQAESGESSG